MEQRSIAIDGPAGAGKSTLARMAAKRFGRVYVDTGALYRCIGLFALRNGVASRDELGVTALLGGINVELTHDAQGVQRVILNGEDVSDDIRTPEVSVYASDVSAMPPVRKFLLSMQREMADKYDVIMDGRDIGTVIMPNAGLKIFLTAEAHARGERRYLELAEKNAGITLGEVIRDMASRDKNDSEREAAPLKAAGDAIVLDTTRLSLEESSEALCGMIEERFRP